MKDRKRYLRQCFYHGHGAGALGSLPGTELVRSSFTDKKKQSRLSAFCSVSGIAFCLPGRLYDLAAFAAFGQ